MDKDNVQKLSTYSEKITEADKENIDTLLTTILVIHTDFIRRISHPEPGMKQKKFFKLLVKDFNKHVSEIIDQICNIH